ncbi:MAG: hypothetical protein J6V09_04060 [Clostridia bacterium]|nr:hypothetical protein [Clostridia bacterium]
MGFDITAIDKAFKLETSINRTDVEFYCATSRPFKLYGVYHDGTQFRRMPGEIAEAANPGVFRLSTNTSGGRVRFVTDSPYVAIRAELPHNVHFAHMALAGVAGFDMYVTENGRQKYVAPFMPKYDFEDFFERIEWFDGENKSRLVTINFPLYNDVYNLYIGLKEGSHVNEPPEYTVSDPIVYYGSSITQGGCASRPGNCYAALLSRRYDADYINLGFSGSGKGEAVMAEYIAGLKMSAFVMDYDHNAPGVAEYECTHEPFFKTVRSKNPDLPIIMATRPKVKSFMNEKERARIPIAERTYKNALAAGDKNVYFIPGYELMELAGDGGLVDFHHPTDLGFFSMAKRFAAELDKIFKPI